MIDNFYRTMTYLSPLVLLIGIIIGFLSYKKLSIVSKGLVWYFVMLLAVDILSRILYLFNNNLIVLLIYSLLEMLMFSYFYFKYLYKSRQRLLLIAIALATAYIIWELLAFNLDFKQFQSYSKVVDNFIIISLALAYFHEKINRFRESKWDNFQLNTVILIFFSVNLILFLPINFLINESLGIKVYFWQGILITTVLFYLYLTWSIWKNGRTQRS